MALFGFVVADIIHFIKLLIIGDFYLKLDCKGEKKQRILSAIIIIMIVSSIMHLNSNLFLGFICYITTIIISIGVGVIVTIAYLFIRVIKYLKHK